MALKTKNQPAPTEHTHPSMGVRSPTVWCEVDGCQIAVQQIPREILQDHAASLQPIVCLHSAGSGSREYRPLLNQRVPGTQIILLDWPAHGRSHCPPTSAANPLTVEGCSRILQAVLNQLGIRRPILLASGFGAAVALRYTADHPKRVHGLVLCQPAGLIHASNPQRSRASWSLLPSKTSSKGASAQQALRQAAVQRRMQHQLAQIESSLLQSQPLLRSALKSSSCPILFALSRKSREYPIKRYLDLLDPLLASAPQHRFTVFTGSFHPVWNEPERFAQALTSFTQALLPVEKHQHAWLLAAVDWPAGNTNLWKCVHPDCRAERVLPAGENANDLA
jgi:pimeloyl-ACP methyl ester carboxylesterase